MTHANSYEVFASLYGRAVTTTEPKFKAGDRVRLSLYASLFVDPNKLKFRKGYRSRFTKDVYTMVETDFGSPHLYRLEENEGDLLPSRYYEPEMSLYTGDVGETEE